MPKPGLNVPGAMPVVYIIVLYLHEDTLNDTHKRFTSVGFPKLYIFQDCASLPYLWRRPKLDIVKIERVYVYIHTLFTDDDLIEL